GLPHAVTLPVDGFGPVVFCHATPRNDEEVVVVDSCLERWAEVLEDLPDEVMTVVCGHTHMPFTRLANSRQVINPGSVGMPYGRPGAHWAILRGGAVEMRRTAYDPRAACAQITAASSYPDAAEWAGYFLYARATDADAPWRPSARETAGRSPKLPAPRCLAQRARLARQHGPGP